MKFFSKKHGIAADSFVTDTGLNPYKMKVDYAFALRFYAY
jgi:hypothetical protein